MIRNAFNCVQLWVFKISRNDNIAKKTWGEEPENLEKMKIYAWLLNNMSNMSPFYFWKFNRSRQAKLKMQTKLHQWILNFFS